MFEPCKSTKVRYEPFKSFSFINRYRTHNKIYKYISPDEKILDIGCSAGYLAKLLKKKNCFIYGIEIDNEAAIHAKEICDEVIIGDIESCIDKIPNLQYNKIIFADVLEHLYRPDIVLKRISAYLAPTGQIIAVIPNIAFIFNRLRLLFGKFEYTQTGLLDITHLRFFTLHTAKQLFLSSGYHIDKFDSIPLHILPGLLSYKFLIIAGRRTTATY